VASPHGPTLFGCKLNGPRDHGTSGPRDLGTTGPPPRHNGLGPHPLLGDMSIAPLPWSYLAILVHCTFAACEPRSSERLKQAGRTNIMQAPTHFQMRITEFRITAYKLYPLTSSAYKGAACNVVRQAPAGVGDRCCEGPGKHMWRWPGPWHAGPQASTISFTTSLPARRFRISFSASRM
jgi:hypothetical protein